MTRLTRGLFIVTLLFRGAATAQNRVEYVLRSGEEPPTWCIYADHSVFQREVERVQSNSVATISITGASVAAIEFTEQADSGDWLIRDRYLIDKRGRVNSLVREIRMASVDLVKREAYSLLDGRLRRDEVSMQSLSSGALLANAPNVWIPQRKVTGDLRDFPFAALINNKVHERGPHCLQEHPQK
jgi:hypothetical protein